MGSNNKIDNEGDGFYTIKDVPVFECHDTRGFNCDEEWMKGAIQNFARDKENGHRPTVILGHNVKGVEKEAYGFLDNFKLKGKRLYADLVRVPRELKEKIVRNAYPSRSVEVLPQSKRILALALLGGTAPYFSLPQMVYAQDEQSQWYTYTYRSPNMNDNENKTPTVEEIAQRAAQEAVAQYSQQLEQAAQAEEPTVYNLTIPQATQLLQDNPDVQLFEAEDGHAYCQSEDGSYYQIPDQLAYGVRETAARVGTRVLRKAKQAAGHLRGMGGKAKNFIGPHEAPGRISRAAGAVREAARDVGRGAHYPTLGSVGNKAQRVGSVIGGTGRAIVNNPGKVGLAVGGVAGAGGAAAAMHGHKKHRYQIDDETGVVYFDGHPIGEVAMYNDADSTDALPPADTSDPSLVVSPTGENTTGQGEDPGAPDNGMLMSLNRDDSDQFSQIGEAVNYTLEQNDAQNIELYNLRQQVDQLKYANDLHLIARKGEGLKTYLLAQKKSGTPIGDIDTTVDYLLSQSDEQVAQFKKMLESSPKIQLGTKYEATPSAGEAETAIRADYSNNKEQYQALGVKEDDLKYARYVRTNRFTNESPTNGENILG